MIGDRFSLIYLEHMLHSCFGTYPTTIHYNFTGEVRFQVLVHQVVSKKNKQ